MKKINFGITYEISVKGEAIQWLSPQQTVGKKHFYLFSQCQPIHARYFYTCQVTPHLILNSLIQLKLHVIDPLVTVMSAKLIEKKIKKNNFE